MTGGGTPQTGTGAIASIAARSNALLVQTSSILVKARTAFGLIEASSHCQTAMT